MKWSLTGAVVTAAILATSVAFAQQAEEKVTIGKLGQAVKASTIFTTPNLNGKKISSAREFQYLVVSKAGKGDWYSVVLVNGQKGYIPADRVVELPYTVQIPKDRTVASYTPSRSSSNARNSRASVNDKESMLAYSFNYIGTPYKWGGNDINNGIDCSAFVKQLFGMIGESLPRTAAEQAKVGTPVNRLEDLQVGDRLYFWDKKRGKIGHTGIYLGTREDGLAYFIHSSSNNKGVDVDVLNDQRWLSTLVAVRRD